MEDGLFPTKGVPVSFAFYHFGTCLSRPVLNITTRAMLKQNVKHCLLVRKDATKMSFNGENVSNLGMGCTTTVVP